MGASAGFDIEAAWELSPQVAVRPESFGALSYHFGTRRLSFLKSPRLLGVVQTLHEWPTARAACQASGVSADERPVIDAALERLARTGFIVRRATA